MKTFKDLVGGDKIIIKSHPKYLNCRTKVNGHLYVKELKYTDTEFTLTHKPTVCTDGGGVGFGGPLVFEIYVRESAWPGQWPTRIKVPYYEYRDKAETDRIKIVQD